MLIHSNLDFIKKENSNLKKKIAVVISVKKMQPHPTQGKKRTKSIKCLSPGTNLCTKSGAHKLVVSPLN